MSSLTRTEMKESTVEIRLIQSQVLEMKESMVEIQLIQSHVLEMKESTVEIQLNNKVTGVRDEGVDGRDTVSTVM